MNSVKQLQFRRQNVTLQEAKLLSVNQQQKNTNSDTIKKVVKRPPQTKYSKVQKRRQKVSKKGKYQGKFIYIVFFH